MTTKPDDKKASPTRRHAGERPQHIGPKDTAPKRDTRFKAGNPGKPKGALCKIPMSLKATVMEVFGRMGESDGLDGKAALLRWAQRNPESFYTRMIAPMLPRHVEFNPEDHAKALAALIGQLRPKLAAALAEAIDVLEAEGKLL
jgi:hypothetical protein